MRLHRFWMAVLPFAAIFLAHVVHAQSEILPQCSSDCLADLIPQSACAHDNQTCICTNAELKVMLNGCVTANCTLKEGLTTLGITDVQCGAPVRDQTFPSILIPAIGLGALIFIPLRIYTHLAVSKMDIGIDDWAMILLGCCVIPVNIGSILLGKAGLGKDIWTLEFQNITKILYLFYIQELIYIFCVSLTKICFLLFYLRIFPSDRIRFVIKISCAMTLCYATAFLFALGFQCSPVSHNWNGWDGEHNGNCVNKNALVVTAAAFNIVLDVWVIALPIPRVLKLQASASTKLQVVFMFCLGFLITGVSLYRTVMLKIFATSTNPTWDNAAGGYWSIIEVDVGVFCLCMPAMRSLLGRIFPRVFGTTKGVSSVGQSSSQRRIHTSTASRNNTSFTQLIEMDNTASVNIHGGKH